MHYQPYFRLQLFHPYYRDQICPDFGIVPSQACERLLKGHRLVLKPSVNGLEVLVPLDTAQQPLIPLAPALTFTFLLQLQNPAFVSLTQFDVAYNASRSLYVASNDGLDHPGTLTLPAEIIAREALNSPATHSPVSLVARCAAIAEVHTRQHSPLFGVVEIRNNGSLSPDFSQCSNFKLTFAAKQQIWAYYLVTHVNDVTGVFSIQDKAAEITFAEATIDPSDRIVTAIQQRFPDSHAVLLKSQTPVPCRATGRPHLQLLKQGHSKPWIPHLPNPPNPHGAQVINLLEEV